MLFAPVVGLLVMSVAVPAAHADTLRIKAKGRIQGACQVIKTRDFPQLILSNPGTGTGTANLKCNMPFVVRVVSARGALVNPLPASPVSTNRVPYSLSVNVPLDSGSSVSAMCASSTLLAGQSGCTLSPAGPGLSSNGAPSWNKTVTVAVSWRRMALALINGSYVDQITLSIGTQP